MDNQWIIIPNIKEAATGNFAQSSHLNKSYTSSLIRVIEKIQNHPEDFSVLENNYLMNTSTLHLNSKRFEFRIGNHLFVAH